MRLYVLGICGTFMAGIAMLAKQQGHDVRGADLNIYPPMSDQLREQGIEIVEGYDPSSIDAKTDCVIVGNVIKRGNPAIEYVLSQNIPYTSGPAWLADNILRNKKMQVLGVAGTHGKTTTSSLLAWILECAGFNPGFLIGGVPENFGVSARLGGGHYFVIEADEYDSAFFDKRPKFIHYHPQIMVLNNLEFDHADIFSDLAAIKLQFHHLIKTLPGSGRLIYHGEDTNLEEVIEQGCWTKTMTFGAVKHDWHAKLLVQDGSAFEVYHQQQLVGQVSWPLLGQHNVNNALAALAAADCAGVPRDQACLALSTFKNVKRRLELKGVINHIFVYDDFAHHPTAIATTLAGLRAKIGHSRMIAVVEFGSYTMRSGVHKHHIQEAFKLADIVVCKNTETEWGLKSILANFHQPTRLYNDVDTLVEKLIPELHPGDHVVIMSNASFGGIHKKLLDAIEKS